MSDGNLVLIADDSIITRQLIRRILKSIGYERIIEAKNGQEALDRALKTDDPVGLLLLDWTMPQLTGIEVLQRLRASHAGRRIPVIMVSAESAPERIAEALRMGANGYVTKPFNPNELRVKISDALRVVRIDQPATLQGNLEELGFPAIVQLALATSLTGTLTVRDGEQVVGELAIEAGAVRACSYRGLAGEQAFLEMAPVRTGTFAFVAGAKAARPNIETPAMQLLLEAMKRQDEALRSCAA